MILNNSRAEYYRACGTLAYNTDELKLTGMRTASPLLIGGAFHKALAIINSKSGNLDEAADLAEQEYRERANWSQLLKEERTLAEADIRMVRSMVRVYGENYIEENYQVLAPEVSFCVPLPDTRHHCRYFHRLLLRENLLSESNTQEPGSGCTDERCWQPHYLTGTTDAVIAWSKAVWLQEHKTTAYDLYNDTPQSKNWIANWHLSTQASTYIYGIWKSIEVRPNGVLLNVVIKPRKNAANPQFSFYREAFVRTEKQLLQFEREVSLLADDYESRMESGKVWKDPRSCFNYNRRCDFHADCVEGELHLARYAERSSDYVNLAYYKILGIDPPVTPQPQQEVREEHAL